MKKHNPGRTLRRVLIIHKDSTYQTEAIEKKDARFLKLIAEGSEIVKTVPRSHEQHIQTMAQVEKALAVRGIAYDVVNRQFHADIARDVDLIVTVGGDGTFLHSARESMGIPILGVNSAKPSSLGHFCLADGDSFGEILDGILSGDPLLSVRGDIAEECWRILTPVLDSWASGEVPLDEYTAGSYGPPAWN